MVLRAAAGRRAPGPAGTRPVTRAGLLGRTEVAGRTCGKLAVTSAAAALPGTTRVAPSLAFVGIGGIVAGELICGRSYLHEAGVLKLSLLLSEESGGHVAALIPYSGS